MPYRSIADLPPSVKNHLPAGAQKIYKGAFNAVFDELGEESAHRIAWASVKKKYGKSSAGKWVKIS